MKKFVGEEYSSPTNFFISFSIVLLVSFSHQTLRLPARRSGSRGTCVHLRVEPRLPAKENNLGGGTLDCLLGIHRSYRPLSGYLFLLVRGHGDRGSGERGPRDVPRNSLLHRVLPR